ncbi:MAG: hypothetical protein ACEQSR_00920 [Candidatus Methylacidiphilales bacterium]
MKEFTFAAVMNSTNNTLFSNYYSPVKVCMLLFCIVLNFINFDSKASTLNSNNSKNNCYYLNIQEAHHQQIPVSSKSESTKVPSINLEEEDDFLPDQYLPEMFCFEVFPIQSNKVINEEKFFIYFHPELTVPPPKTNTFESFC